MDPSAKKLAALREQLTQLCERHLETVGYDCVALEYLRDQQGWVLRVFIDFPAGAGDESGKSGITHEDCKKASHHLSAVLDVEDPIEAAYRLEVSSPGVRRPLRRLSDYQRFAGQLARVSLHEPLNGRKNYLGRLTEASTEEDVALEIDGQRVELPLRDVKKAHLEVEF